MKQYLAEEINQGAYFKIIANCKKTNCNEHENEVTEQGLIPFIII